MSGGAYDYECYRFEEQYTNRMHDAEMNAIISASRDDMLGSTLYLFGSENGSPITSEPCPVCMRLIKNAGIESVVGYKEREENA